MALKRHFKKKQHGVMLKSGNAYTFKYQSWENDPHPTFIYMYSYSGTHPTTNRQWRFHQGINMTYIPRSVRRQFAREWISILRSTNNPKFTWEKVSARYPYLKNAVRRYFYSPTYYISNLKEINFEDFEKVVVSTWSKDFSKKVKTSLIGKFRRVMRGRRQFKKTGRFPGRV
jgi:hypothetical protein